MLVVLEGVHIHIHTINTSRFLDVHRIKTYSDDYLKRSIFK